MKVLNEMEVGMVSGGVDLCSPEDVIGLGEAIPAAVGDFFAGMNDLGSQLGIWLFNYVHGC